MNYVLAHGIRTEGTYSIDRIGPPLRDLGHGVHDCELPVRRTWSVKRTLEKDAEQLVQCLMATSVPREVRSIIAHSHGCHIALEAAKMIDVGSIWLFNPAVSVGYNLDPVRCDKTRIYCIYSPSDWIVFLGSIIPFHPFGKAGKHGLKNLPEANNLESNGGHSEAFKHPRIEQWAEFIHKKDAASLGVRASEVRS